MTDVADRPIVTHDLPPAEPAPGMRSTAFDLAELNQWVLASLLASAGVIHLVMVPSHIGGSVADGASFLFAGWIQLGLAVAIVTRPARWMLHATILANVVFVAAWGISRVWGLPYGEHAGQAATASFVDLVCVGLEVAAVVAAVAFLVRPHLGVGAGGIAFGIPLLAVALGTAAIASPSARDHASTSHADHAHGDELASAGPVSDGHDHDHADGEAAAADDKGLSLLTNGHQHESGVVALDAATQAKLDEQLAATADLVRRFPTVAAAEAAGYRRAGPFAPGLGTHYQPPEYHLNPDGVMDPEDLPWPMLIFDGVAPDSPIAGFMYLSIGTSGVPEGFAGPNDHWHYHERVCIVAGPNGQIDTPFGADLEGITQEMCDGVGGVFVENTGYMVHVWTVPGYESPEGIFTEINPALDCPDGTYYMIPIEELGTRDTTCLNSA